MVLINCLTEFETKCGIWCHIRGLDEWLELIAGMSWCSLKTNDSFNWLFTKHWISKSASNMWELLIITPLDFVLVSLIVIIVCGGWTILQSFLVIELLSLREPGSCWFSPSVIILKVDVLQLGIRFVHDCILVESFWDVALCIEILWSDLSNMHVNHIGVKTIDIEHLVLVITINVDWMLDMEVFVWKDYLWLAIFVSWGSHIVNFEIPVFLGLINLEEEILSCNDLIIGLSSKSLA